MKLPLSQALLKSIALKSILISVLILQYWRKVSDLKIDKYTRYMMMPLLALSQLNYILTYCLHIEPYALRSLISLLVVVSTTYFRFKG